ncbi:MAG: mechanosensitive ion channel [Rhodovibrionaceae bacterium]|nr:mechanosensitive ion channel [Rhodovibrionaceae bacterium]
METVESLFDPIWLESTQMRLEHWLVTDVLAWTTLLQVALLLVLGAMAILAGRLLKPRVARLAAPLSRFEGGLKALGETLPGLSVPAVLLVLSMLARALMAQAGQPTALLTVAISLLAAWIVIRLSASLIRNRELARGVAVAVWVLAALNIVGLLGPAIEFLDQLALPIGARQVSVLTLINALLLLALLLWGARVLGRFLAARIDRSRALTPSIKVLTQKSVHIVLLASAFLISLDYLGIDLTAFAVFTGAVGVGVGFGLQKVVSNLISGFILLMDRSIKPGDVIELEETFGWVTSLGARYVALSTRDGKEWLIPNEDLITQRVINWSYTNQLLRLPLRFGISYHSDVRLAMELSVEAASTVKRVLQDPQPVCRLIGFGDSSVDFELRVWISDPQGGVMNVRSEIFLAMWEKFREHGIEIPFPQRDLHIKPGSQLSVRMSEAPTPPEPSKG